MHHWLLKTEPDEFSWTRQVELGRAGGVWDGVRNHQAARYLREMAAGDRAFFYHTGSERRIVGIVEITRAAFPDPTDPSGRFVSVMTRALEPLPRPVTLAEIKADPQLADFLLVRQPRLSVLPVEAAHWQRILDMAGTP
jgi:predicted RNA-binding protein with PUA-like domain